MKSDSAQDGVAAERLHMAGLATVLGRPPPQCCWCSNSGTWQQNPGTEKLARLGHTMHWPLGMGTCSSSCAAAAYELASQHRPDAKSTTQQTLCCLSCIVTAFCSWMLRAHLRPGACRTPATISHPGLNRLLCCMSRCSREGILTKLCIST
jgi:hypothetical protein